MRKQSKKILIIRPGAIGDVVHTTIIPVSIKKSHPDYIIHYMTQKEIAPILENNPYVDKIIPIDRSKRKSIKYMFSIYKQLLNERYDIIFNLTLSLRNILLSILSFPKRIVFRKHLDGSWVEDFFYTAKSAIKDIQISDKLYLGISETDKPKIETIINDCPKPYIIIVPAGNNNKNRQGRLWDIDYWKELTEKILTEYKGTIFVCGSKSEKEQHSKLERDNVVITSGMLTLSESNNLLSHADIVISGDTGPIHIASAHNVPTLALLGSTSPDKIKPYGENGFYISANTDCKYCWKKKCPYLKNDEIYTPCMNNITPDMVFQKFKEILSHSTIK